jgi:aldehyde:ferredoxin oxidoreductase
VKTIEEMRQAHKVLATYSYKPARINKGYTDRRLYINLTKNVIEERAIDPMVKEKFTGGAATGCTISGRRSNRRRTGMTPRMS